MSRLDDELTCDNCARPYCMYSVPGRPSCPMYLVDDVVDAEIISDGTGVATSHMVGGSHYKGYEIEPVEYIEKNKFTHCTAAIIKYASRLGKKEGIEGTIKDLMKVRHYAALYAELNLGVNIYEEEANTK